MDLSVVELDKLTVGGYFMVKLGLVILLLGGESCYTCIERPVSGGRATYYNHNKRNGLDNREVLVTKIPPGRLESSQQPRFLSSCKVEKLDVHKYSEI